MTRTGKSPRLSQHLAEPFAEIHPDDARLFGVADADIVCVRSAQGEVLVRALLTSRQSRGTVFVPMHWTDQFASSARVDRLVPAVTDPHSGQPASKCVPVAMSRFDAAHYGFAVASDRAADITAEYWAIAKCNGGWRLELAFSDGCRDWHGLAAALFAPPSSAETLAYHDEAAGRQRFACFDGDRLVGALFLAAEPVAVSRDWACVQLLQPHKGQRARMLVLAGRPGAGFVDRGATVCSCFGVGANEIVAAAAAGCLTLDAIGQALKAGTNCGSCRSEIRRLIDKSGLQVNERGLQAAE